MRTSVLIGAMSAALVVFACEEHFPKSNVTSVPGESPDASSTTGPLEASPPAQIPPDARLGTSSSNVAWDALRGTVWVANGDVGTITEVDVDNAKIIAELTLGGEPTSICVSPDGAFVAAPDHAAGQVTLVYAESRATARAIAIGTRPRGCVFDAADPRWLYVATEDGIAVVDRTLGVLSRMIPAGRLPTHVAMPKGERTLIVSHRIDAKVSFIDVSDQSPASSSATPPVPLDVPLADEPRGMDPKVPNGRPFAFEGLALSAAGDTLWVPHELLAITHPFQFQSVIFPAVSVVDVHARAEVVTDPTTGVIDGRKNLFDAINVLSPTGDAMVFSQPCAAALHPNGNAAYVLACGSEDFITFDLTQGIAISALRTITGDHPSGIALDATGARAFVYASESHDLSVIDTRGGSIIDPPRVFGAAIKTVANDPVDPALRLGRTLFFRASSRKGDLAITGNNWMSCGACHLDGFRETNSAFFEALSPNEKVDAARGHAGLVDFFASVPAWKTPASFNPHDVLSAVADQGGLAPDRTGQDRTGAVDPNAPTADAITMATALASVVASDLPAAPTWLLADATSYSAAYDGAWCGNCHQAEYAAWQKSVHSRAGSDTMVGFCARLESGATTPTFNRLCEGCHSPKDTGSGAVAKGTGAGVTCRSCHDTTALTHAGGNAGLTSSGAAIDWQADHKASATASLPLLRSVEFCGACHQQFVPGTGVVGINTFGEYAASPYAGKSACIDCHMPKSNGVADHAALGGNLYIATNDAAALQTLKGRLGAAVALAATKQSDGNVHVVAKNVNVGHAFPTGVADLKDAWVELQAVDASRNVVARYGSLLDNPKSAVPGRLGVDYADANGAPLNLHEVIKVATIPFDKTIPAQGSLELVLPPPASLPPPAVELDAVLYYRNIRVDYAQAAGGASQAPFEMARTKVQ